MKRWPMVLLSLLLLIVVGAALSPSLLTGYGQQRPRKKRPPVAEAPSPPTTATLAEGLVTLRVAFKSKGKAKAKVATTWDGRLDVSRGRLDHVRLWQDDPRDSVQGAQWKLSTHAAVPWFQQQRKRNEGPPTDAALKIELSQATAETELEFETEQGDFSFTLRDVAWGTTSRFLGGLAQVDRIANVATILSAPSEDDFPSALVGRDGRLYVAYVAFTHAEDFRRRTPLAEPPEELGHLAQPTGGDQVLLLRLDGDRWTGPLAVTPANQDVYRTAIAADGTGRIWVFWSAGKEGNWDLYARSLTGDKWSAPLRLTSAPGPDTFPAATTNSSGKVWVAWQAFREGHSDILAIRQEGQAFTEEIVVADAAGNQWTPAIAASSDGQVAVAWDSYENGNYDVFTRIWADGKFGERVPIAASPRAEMRPSATYDAAGRLWVAYEDSPEKWGKDWGALEKEGTALYQQRTVGVRVWTGNQLRQPAGNPAAAFQPGVGARKQTGQGPQLAAPRLTADASGRVWLAVRSPRLGVRAPVGTAWLEHVAWYEGQQWSDEIICPGTDNLLDNRPALLPLETEKILMVGSSDGRLESTGGLPNWYLNELRRSGQQLRTTKPSARWPDAVNNELVMAEFGPVSGQAARPPKLEPVKEGVNSIARVAAEVRQEAAAIARARAARVTVGGKTLRLWRGEFHRHTEISGDGGGDGMLMDMWRYGLDAAGLDWIGNGDHDNGGGREYSWWIVQKTTDLFGVPNAFTPMYTYERSCSYPDGHRNVVFARRGVRTLPRLRGGMGKAMDDLPAEADRPHTPDTQMLYRYLAHFDGVCASHTSGTNMGTDWRDNDPKVEPIVEIYQGCRQSYEMPGAPRSNTAENSIGGWRPFGFVSLALKKGHRLGFQSSSDHISTHISYCNVWAEAPTRDAILAAMKARHVYGSTDNIVAQFRCGDHFMGDEFALKSKPSLKIRLEAAQPFAKVHVIKDGNYVHSIEPDKREVELEWTDFNPKPGKTSYYYVRGEQTDGELVWVSPMWITYSP